MAIWNESDYNILIVGARWVPGETSQGTLFGCFQKLPCSLSVTIIDCFRTRISFHGKDFCFDTRCKDKTQKQSMHKVEAMLTAQLLLNIFSSALPFSKYLQTRGTAILQTQRMALEIIKASHAVSRTIQRCSHRGTDSVL